MKTCSICKLEKAHSEFHKRSRSKDGYTSQCAECKHGMDQSYYTRNTDKFKDRNDINRAETTHKLFDYLSKNPCVDCGEQDVVVLEFDHKEEKPKYRVATLVSHSWAAVLKEIENCEIRCSNCHTRKTHERANTPRWKYANPE